MSYLKQAFKRSKIDYSEVVINKDMSAERFKELFPKEICCPFCTLNTKPLGGLTTVVTKLVKEGYLTKTK